MKTNELDIMNVNTLKELLTNAENEINKLRTESEKLNKKFKLLYDYVKSRESFSGASRDVLSDLEEMENDKIS